MTAQRAEQPLGGDYRFVATQSHGGQRDPLAIAPARSPSMRMVDEKAAHCAHSIQTMTRNNPSL
jgi:hypothetical protein